MLPSTHAPAFAAEARRQARAVARAPNAAADQAFVDAVADPETCKPAK